MISDGPVPDLQWEASSQYDATPPAPPFLSGGGCGCSDPATFPKIGHRECAGSWPVLPASVAEVPPIIHSGFFDNRSAGQAQAPFPADFYPA